MEKMQVYGFEMIRIEDISEIVKRERTLLIDLRSEESYRKGHIKNARNYPYADMEDWREEIPDGISLILYCEHGNLSLLSAKKLRGRKGGIYTLLGGYQEVAREGAKEGIDTVVFKR